MSASTHGCEMIRFATLTAPFSSSDKVTWIMDTPIITTTFVRFVGLASIDTMLKPARSLLRGSNPDYSQLLLE